MEKRLLELIFTDYMNSIENPPIHLHQDTKKLNKKVKKEILEKFSTPIKPLLEQYKEKKEIKIKEGNVYFFFKDHIPIYYLVINKLNDLYEVLKVSNYWELGNQNDLVTKINEEIFIIETWNNFFLTEEEIKESVYIGKLKVEDYKILKKFLKGKIKQLPENKKGLTVPEGDYNFYQNKFHKKESELVREYKLRFLV